MDLRPRLPLTAALSSLAMIFSSRYTYWLAHPVLRWRCLQCSTAGLSFLRRPRIYLNPGTPR
jgi:hypothetical protein